MGVPILQEGDPKKVEPRQLLHLPRVTIPPVFGLGSGVPPSLPLCLGIFDSKFAFVDMSTAQTSHLLC